MNNDICIYPDKNMLKPLDELAAAEYNMADLRHFQIW